MPRDFQPLGIRKSSPNMMFLAHAPGIELGAPPPAPETKTAVVLNVKPHNVPLARPPPTQIMNRFNNTNEHQQQQKQQQHSPGPGLKITHAAHIVLPHHLLAHVVSYVCAPQILTITHSEQSAWLKSRIHRAMLSSRPLYSSQNGGRMEYHDEAWTFWLHDMLTDIRQPPNTNTPMHQLQLHYYLSRGLQTDARKLRPRNHVVYNHATIDLLYEQAHNSAPSLYDPVLGRLIFEYYSDPNAQSNDLFFDKRVTTSGIPYHALSFLKKSMFQESETIPAFLRDVKSISSLLSVNTAMLSALKTSGVMNELEYFHFGHFVKQSKKHIASAKEDVLIMIQQHEKRLANRELQNNQDGRLQRDYGQRSDFLRHRYDFDDGTKCPALCCFSGPAREMCGPNTFCHCLSNIMGLGCCVVVVLGGLFTCIAAWLLYASIDPYSVHFANGTISGGFDTVLLSNQIKNVCLLASCVSVLGGLFCVVQPCVQYVLMCTGDDCCDDDYDPNGSPWCEIRAFEDSGGWREARKYVFWFGVAACVINIPVFYGGVRTLMYVEELNEVRRNGNYTEQQQSTVAAAFAEVEQWELLAWMVVIASGSAICCGLTNVVRGLVCCEGHAYWKEEEYDSTHT
jgi:hypothetical protein